MHALQDLRAKRYSDGRGRLMSAGNGWTLQPVIELLLTCACLSHAASLCMKSTQDRDRLVGTDGLRRDRPCLRAHARTRFPRLDGQRTARPRSSLPCS